MPARHDRLGDACIEVVITLGLDRVVLQSLGLVGRADIFAERRVGHELERRGREIAGIACMKHAAAPGAPDDVDARTHLLGMGVFIDTIEAQTVIDRQVAYRTPFILSVEPIHPASAPTAIMYVGCAAS